ncbi:phosphotransferase [Planotetraspora sp. A-T 1434]|uniref:phosphotransferase enzyme family protein n=1 Tax=Planotetraspora sp. A-T 1434 TaxID=2979219 RepID=UPI0021BFD270|nr:phosphotransferase [Planotetraspora sp. A-T 1434]MCT9929277.1 phosphotransferase [Planotetraspora sp. A-T 1434]
MEVHDLSGGPGVLARVEEAARRALRRYDLSPHAAVTLISVSENATFAVEDSGSRTILRVHRLGYHTLDAIVSELDWLEALRAEAGIRTPAVIPARDGSRVVAVEDPGAEPRACVMFEFLPGGEPAEERLAEHFEPLGALTARMHRHAREWARPSAFTRFHWDCDAAFGPIARWGRWQDGAGVDKEAHAVLTRLEATLRDRLGRFGKGRERYGLIHADLRLANLLVDGQAGTSVIDFDDCGLGWYLYDFGAAVSFIEHHPQVPQMIDSWLRGYRTVLDLPKDDEDEIWTFVMFRRLLLVAWIGSHTGVEFARGLGAGYTRGACELAERYLSGSL